MMWLGEVALVALGGALGASSRYGVERIGWFDSDPYYYTVVINITGCFVIGVLYSLITHFHAERWVYLLTITGFLGGYTTYSAFALDAMLQWDTGRFGVTLLYIALTLFGGLGACALALYVTRWILKS